MNNTISRRGLVALIASMLSWGLGNPFADMAIDAFSITQLLLLEISIGFAFVALYVLIKFLLGYNIIFQFFLLYFFFTFFFVP